MSANGPHKILVVKLGYSETLIPQVRRKCSLGDVFRSTVVLHLFENDRVTWLTDEAAVPLLKGNPYIHRLLTLDLLSTLQLEGERFDKIVNLEKVPGICALVGRIHAWGRYGFRFDEQTGEANAYDRAYEALEIATQEQAKRASGRSYAEVLYAMLGSKWEGQGYVLGYKPVSAEKYDLGFNVNVGSLIPTKAWPAEYWKELEGLVTGQYTYCYQQHPDNLEGYMEWIHSCRMIITNDSLGMFLGVALGKKVVALFGPTPATDISPHSNLRRITPSVRRDCIPCLRSACQHETPCMRHISPQTVWEAIQEWRPHE